MVGWGFNSISTFVEQPTRGICFKVKEPYWKQESFVIERLSSIYHVGEAEERIIRLLSDFVGLSIMMAYGCLIRLELPITVIDQHEVSWNFIDEFNYRKCFLLTVNKAAPQLYQLPVFIKSLRCNKSSGTKKCVSGYSAKAIIGWAQWIVEWNFLIKVLNACLWLKEKEFNPD